MVGIYGTIGTSDEFDQVQEHFFFTGNEYPTTYRDSDRSIHAVFHNKQEAESQPVEHENIYLFIWGEICGHGNLNEYESRKDIEIDFTDAEYCARLYKKHGINFIKKLNSNFAGVIFDNESSKTHLFTDRLGSRPLYYTRPTNDSLIFSTNLQAIARHSDYEIQFEKELLCQYLTIYRVLGIYTPLKNIKKVHPGSIMTFDSSKSDIEKKMYWKPEYKPLNKNFQCFIDWFSEIFDNVMYDRLDKMKDYGFLLSGGTDSRLIADYLNNEKAFHVNETMNREARLSKKVAKMTKNKFHFLKRNREYLPEILEEVSPLMNFNSTFQQGWSIGFKEVLNDCDVIIHGTRADVMLQGYVIPKRYIPFSKIPIKAKVNSLVDYITYIENYNPKYINFDFELKKSVSMNSKNIKINKVKYKSEEDVLRYGKIYPFTNLQNFFNIEHLYQINKVYSPYKDNRILDFSQYFPTKYQLRRNLIKKILYKKNKNLSKLIHPSSLQPSYRDELIHYFFRYLHLKLDKLKNHMKGEGPWPNYKKIIKDTGYAEENIKENKEILEAFDYLNYKNAISMIQNEQYHSVQQIHSLLSFLKIYDKITC